MWQHFWPGLPSDQVPIHSVTNGIHAPTWIAPDLTDSTANRCSRHWAEHCDDPAMWQRVTGHPRPRTLGRAPDHEAQTHGIHSRTGRTGWMHGQLQPSQVLTRGTLLDPEALTIGFARRFATYKRATLLFRISNG